MAVVFAQYQAVVTNATLGDWAALTLTQDRKLRVESGSGTAGAPSGAVQTVQEPEEGATLSRASVTMTGASAQLVAASASRLIVIVSNTDSNNAAVVDPTGGTAALDAGIPLLGGATLKITGKAAQSAMTQFGTNGQKLTVYTG